MRLRVAAAFAAAAMIAAGQVGPAAAGHDPGCARTFVHVLRPSTHGNPEGVAWHAPSHTFFVGATGDGTIYRGRPLQRTLRPFITVDPAAGRAAIGMEAVGDKLYVAGGPTGKVFVYRISTRRLIGTFDTGTGGFLNDLVVTPRGHVYVTDSFRPVLWHVTRAQLRAGSGTPKAVNVAPEITYVAGEFNLNGIEFAGRRTVLAIQSATGLLYRITLDHQAPLGRTIQQVAAPPVVGGDGITWDRGRLIVVDGDPARLVFMALTADLQDGFITRERTDAALRGPSSVARAGNRYLVVNADFATSRTPFTVADLKAPRSHPASEIPDTGDVWLIDDLKTRH